MARWVRVQPECWLDDVAYVHCPCGRARFRIRPDGRGTCSQCGREFRAVVRVECRKPEGQAAAQEGAP